MWQGRRPSAYRLKVKDAITLGVAASCGGGGRQLIRLKARPSSSPPHSDQLSEAGKDAKAAPSNQKEPADAHKATIGTGPISQFGPQTISFPLSLYCGSVLFFPRQTS